MAYAVFTKVIQSHDFEIKSYPPTSLSLSCGCEWVDGCIHAMFKKKHHELLETTIRDQLIQSIFWDQAIQQNIFLYRLLSFRS